jgi:hypothetical protein
VGHMTTLDLFITNEVLYPLHQRSAPEDTCCDQLALERNSWIVLKKSRLGPISRTQTAFATIKLLTSLDTFIPKSEQFGLEKQFLEFFNIIRDICSVRSKAL